MLTGCNDKMIRCWDVLNPEAPKVTLTGLPVDNMKCVYTHLVKLGHSAMIKKTLWCDENTIVSGGDDKCIRYGSSCSPTHEISQLYF